MRKYLAVLATVVAALFVSAQLSSAEAFWRKRAPGVTAAQLTVGGAMTGVYLAKTYRHGRFAKFTSARSLKWWGLTTVGCMSLTPIVGAAFVSASEHRELRSSEVMVMAADCVVPILGGLIMQSAFDAHPEWDRGTGRPSRR